jgi:hypothetical protein
MPDTPLTAAELAALKTPDQPLTPEEAQKFDPYAAAKKATSIGAAPPWQARFSRVLTPMGGAISGGLKGARVGSVAGPIGTAIGAVAGAGLGAMGGEALQMGTEAITRLVGTPPPSVAGTAERLGSAATTGMVGEMTGQGTMAGAKLLPKKITAPFKSSLEPYATEAIDKFKGKVLPGEVSKSRVLNVGENIAESGLLSGTKVTAVKAARQKIAEQQVHDVLDSLGPRVGMKATGKALAESRNVATKAFRAEERAVWDVARKAAEDLPMVAPRLDAFIAKVEGQQAGAILPNAGMTAARRAASLINPEEGLTTVGGVQGPLSQLPSSIREAMQKAGHPDLQSGAPITAGQFQQTVSDLGRLMRVLGRAKETDPSKAADYGLAKKLYAVAREDLEEVLAKKPDALAAYDTARGVSLKGNQELFNDELRTLFREEGHRVAREKIVGKMVQPNNSTMIEAVKTAVGPAEFQQVQAETLHKILQPTARTNQVSWEKVISRLDHLADDTLRSLYPDGQDLEIRRVARLMLDLERKPAGATGKAAVQFGQIGGFAGLVTGVLSTPAAVLLAAPPVLAQIFASRTGLKWLTTGLTAPDRSTAAAAFTELLVFTKREVANQQIGTPPPQAQGPGPRRGAPAGIVGAPPP